MKHAFIFEPGEWEGEGLLRFSMATDVIPFVMRWKVDPIEEGMIHFDQIVEIEELNQTMRNHFSLREMTPSRFYIALSNQLVDTVTGLGVIDPKTIAWEFREQGKDFEGFEIYKKETEHCYKMHGEYSTSEALRTYVSGSITKVK